MGYRFGYLLLLIKGCTCGNFHGGNPHVWVILPDDLRNPLPGINENINRKETPYPLSISFTTAGLPKLPRQHSDVELATQGFSLLLSSTGGSALPGSLLHFRVPHQSRVETSIPEVNPT